MSEIELILTKLKIVSEEKENGMYLCDKEHSKILLDYIKEKNKEIERLNNIINEITKTIKDDYFKASDYVRKIEQSGKPQGDYPVYYYYNLKKQELTDEYLNKLQELKGDKNNGK